MKNCYELTINEFTHVMHVITDDTRPRYERELEILKYCNPELSEDYILDLPLEEVDKAIDSIIRVNTGPVLPEITVKDKVFTLKGNPDNFVLSYRQYKTFEKCIHNKDTDYMTKFMATVYVSDDTTFEEREELFKDMKMMYVIHFVMLLNETVNKKV